MDIIRILIFWICLPLLVSPARRSRDKRISRCPKITIENGRVIPRSVTVRFRCNRGFRRYGPRKAICLLGTWNVSPPSCIKRNCKKFTKLNDSLQVAYAAKGGVARFKCDVGLTMEGPSEILCGARGWKALPPKCAHVIPADSCDFETEDLCGWTQSGTDTFDWTVMTGPTLSGYTGPDTDHTYQSPDKGQYLYIETSSPRQPGDRADLYSPVFPADMSDTCFEFWYHMYGAEGDNEVGNLEVYVKPLSEDLESISPSLSAGGNKGNKWIRGEIDVNFQSEMFQIIITATRGEAYVGDIAIDDVAFVNCSESSGEVTEIVYDVTTEDFLPVSTSTLRKKSTVTEITSLPPRSITPSTDASTTSKMSATTMSELTTTTTASLFTSSSATEIKTRAASVPKTPTRKPSATTKTTEILTSTAAPVKSTAKAFTTTQITTGTSAAVVQKQTTPETTKARPITTTVSRRTTSSETRSPPPGTTTTGTTIPTPPTTIFSSVWTTTTFPSNTYTSTESSTSPPLFTTERSPVSSTAIRRSTSFSTSTTRSQSKTTTQTMTPTTQRRKTTSSPGQPTSTTLLSKSSFKSASTTRNPVTSRNDTTNPLSSRTPTVSNPPQYANVTTEVTQPSGNFTRTTEDDSVNEIPDGLTPLYNTTTDINNAIPAYSTTKTSKSGNAALIAAAIIGTIVVILVVGAIVLLWKKYKKKTCDAEEEMQPISASMESESPNYCN